MIGAAIAFWISAIVVSERNCDNRTVGIIGLCALACTSWVLTDLVSGRLA